MRAGSSLTTCVRLVLPILAMLAEAGPSLAENPCLTSDHQLRAMQDQARQIIQDGRIDVEAQYKNVVLDCQKASSRQSCIDQAQTDRQAVTIDLQKQSNLIDAEGNKAMTRLQGAECTSGAPQQDFGDAIKRLQGDVTKIVQTYKDKYSAPSVPAGAATIPSP
jgi:hypothetical protein